MTLPVGGQLRLTPEIQQKIVSAIEAGNYRETAAWGAGISDRTLRRWCERGLAGEAPYEDFVTALKNAEAHAEMRLLDEIREAKPSQGKGGEGADLWQARAWVMERRWPHRWAARVRTVVAEEVEGLEKKLKKDPTLAQRVRDVLTDESTESASIESH